MPELFDILLQPTGIKQMLRQKGNFLEPDFAALCRITQEPEVTAKACFLAECTLQAMEMPQEYTSSGDFGRGVGERMRLLKAKQLLRSPPKQIDDVSLPLSKDYVRLLCMLSRSPLGDSSLQTLGQFKPDAGYNQAIRFEAFKTLLQIADQVFQRTRRQDVSGKLHTLLNVAETIHYAGITLHMADEDRQALSFTLWRDKLTTQALLCAVYIFRGAEPNELAPELRASYFAWRNGIRTETDSKLMLLKRRLDELGASAEMMAAKAPGIERVSKILAESAIENGKTFFMPWDSSVPLALKSGAACLDTAFMGSLDLPRHRQIELALQYAVTVRWMATQPDRPILTFSGNHGRAELRAIVEIAARRLMISPDEVRSSPAYKQLVRERCIDIPTVASWLTAEDLNTDAERALEKINAVIEWGGNQVDRHERRRVDVLATLKQWLHIRTLIQIPSESDRLDGALRVLMTVVSGMREDSSIDFFSDSLQGFYGELGEEVSALTSILASRPVLYKMFPLHRRVFTVAAHGDRITLRFGIEQQVRRNPDGFSDGFPQRFRGIVIEAPRQSQDGYDIYHVLGTLFSLDPESKTAAHVWERVADTYFTSPEIQVSIVNGNSQRGGGEMSTLWLTEKGMGGRVRYAVNAMPLARNNNLRFRLVLHKDGGQIDTRESYRETLLPSRDMLRRHLASVEDVAARRQLMEQAKKLPATGGYRVSVRSALTPEAVLQINAILAVRDILDLRGQGESIEPQIQEKIADIVTNDLNWIPVQLGVTNGESFEQGSLPDTEENFTPGVRSRFAQWDMS